MASMAASRLMRHAPKCGDPIRSRSSASGARHHRPSHPREACRTRYQYRAPRARPDSRPGISRSPRHRGGRKAAWAEEFGEVEEAKLAQPFRFLDRRERPGVDFHIIGRGRPESAHRDRHDVVNHEIGEDDHIAALLGDPVGALFAKPSFKILLDRLDLALAFFAPYDRKSTRLQP